MASKVKICNMALAKIRGRNIQSIDGVSREAKECKKIFDEVRDAVLRAHDWGFASKTQDLALTTDTFTGWEYVYQYPSDCLAAREILKDNYVNTGTSYDIDTDRNRNIPFKPIQFKKATNENKNRVYILTNKEDAELRYTARITDTNLFDANFVEALAFKLASELAYPIKASLKLQQAMLGSYMAFIEHARALDSNEDEKKPEVINSFVRSRY
jgi:hypothetical protein